MKVEILLSQIPPKSLLGFDEALFFLPFVTADHLKLSFPSEVYLC